MSMFDLSNEAIKDGNEKSFLKAGLNIPVKLSSIEVEETSGNLTIIFTGIGTDKGSVTFTSWANNFDSSNSNYKQENAEREISRIKHIVKAFLPEEEAKLISGKDFTSFANAVVKALKKFIDKTDLGLELKVIYNNKDFPTFPTFPNFISSSLRTLPLSLNNKVNSTTGLPFDRIKTLSELGIKPSEGSPSSENLGSESAGVASPGDDLTPTF